MHKRRMGRVRRAVIALTFALLAVLGCATRQLGPPPPAPALESAEDAIPADLDVVLRIDLERMQRALGTSALAELEARARASAGSGADEQKLMSDLLQDARTIWIALRPGDSVGLTDNVVILEGRFAEFDPTRYAAAPAWQPSIDLGGGWRVYERQQPKQRSAPARIYARGNDWVVLVSEAEVDSVEKTIEQRQGGEPLQAPSQGSVSIVARARPLAKRMLDRSPAAARLLARASRLQAHGDLAASGLVAELEVVFDAADDARDAARAAKVVAAAVAQEGGLAGALASQLRVEAVGPVVVVALSLDPDGLAEVVGCATGSLPCPEANAADSTTKQSGGSKQGAIGPDAHQKAEQPGK
jgi:hypothetical protein